MKRYWRPEKSGYWTKRSKKLGRRELVFDDDEALILMKAAIEAVRSHLQNEVVSIAPTSVTFCAADTLLALPS